MQNVVLDQAIQNLVNKRNGRIRPSGNDADLAQLRTVIGRMVYQKLAGPAADLWSFLVRQGYCKDAEFRRYLNEPPNRGGKQQGGANFVVTPDSYQIKSCTYAIIGDLLYGTCDCAARYAGWQKQQTASNDVCQRKHSFDAYLAQAYQVRNPDLYLWHAVHGNTNHPQFNLNSKLGNVFRAFSNSMLCNVIRTPRGGQLQLIRMGESNPILGEALTRHMSFTMREDEAARPYVPPAPEATTYPIWVCLKCEQILGQLGEPCSSPECEWIPVPKAFCFENDSEKQECLDIQVKCCELFDDGHNDCHYWPATIPHCPSCKRRGVVNRKIKIERIPPRLLKFDDIVK